MRLMQDFRRMRFGLGVALLTDGYYGTSPARAVQFNRQAIFLLVLWPPTPTFLCLLFFDYHLHTTSSRVET